MSSRRLALMVLLVLGVAAGAPAGSAAPLAYITNYASGTVSVIDTATNTVVAEVPNLNSPTPTGDFGFPAGVAVTPDGKSVYVTADRGHKVAVIDTATNTAVAIVELRPDPLNGPEWPWGVAVTPDGKRVYVANQTLICIQPCNITFSVSVIDTATNTVVAAVPMPVAPFAVAVTPDGKSVYVTGPDSSTVEVISTATNTDVASVPVGIGPQGVAVSPDGKSVYVAIGGENTLWVISTATTNAVGAKVPVGAHPYGVAVSPDGARVYVTNMDDNTVSVISTATNKVVTVPVGVRPSGVAVTPDGARVYVANSLSNTVSVIDTTKNPPAVAATVRGVGGQPTAFGKFITPGKKADPVVNPPVPQWFQAGIPGATDPQKNGYPGNFWAKQPYDFEVPEATIWAQGCAITALTMLANFWRGGGNLAQPTASNYSTLISPLNLNKLSGLFREPGGGVFFNNFAQIASNNPKLVRVYQACPSTNPCPQQPSNSFPVVGSPPDAKLTLDNLLRNNIPVILPIFEDGSKSASHFVVVTGKQNGTYSVNDPGDVNMKTTDQLQQSKWAIGTGTAKAPQHTVQINVSFDVTKYIVFVNSLTTIPTLDPNTAQALGIYSDAPVEFILTDPQGRRTGFDPVTNTSFQEIPTSAYSSTIYRDEQNFSPDRPPLKALDMANQMTGQYTLDVIGTGSGSFTVLVMASDASGNWIPQTYSGTTAPGASSRFTFQGAVTIFAAFSANVGINNSKNQFAVGGQFTLGVGSSGIDPLTQPVTLEVGAFSITIPVGSFQRDSHGNYVFLGTINGVQLAAGIQPQGGNQYAYGVAGQNATNLPTANPVDIRLAIGSNGGSTSVNANFAQ